MSEIQHFLLGASINFILWHLFFKKYFITQKDINIWTHKIKELFF
jgi:hypothetical protein